MFYRCPNCSELLKKGVNKCPFCGRVIDIKDLDNIQRKEETELQKYEDEYDEEVSSRFKGRIIFSIVSCILFVCFFVLMVTTVALSDLFLVLLIVLVAVMTIFLLTSKSFRCPSCGRNIYRRYGIGQYCSHCGARIR